MTDIDTTTPEADLMRRLEAIAARIRQLPEARWGQMLTALERVVDVAIRELAELRQARAERLGEA